ncbi:MAG: hypothetical protein SH847_17540 [Roseiflexaceae bacterium]|nr:hypothetical protein [Roseiflexaceae bacterium]
MTEPVLQHEQDEYLLETPEVHDFIADVHRILAQYQDVPTGLAALRPRFAALLADQPWLTDAFGGFLHIPPKRCIIRIRKALRVD